MERGRERVEGWRGGGGRGDGGVKGGRGDGARNGRPQGVGQNVT